MYCYKCPCVTDWLLNSRVRLNCTGKLFFKVAKAFLINSYFLRQMKWKHGGFLSYKMADRFELRTLSSPFCFMFSFWTFECGFIVRWQGLVLFKILFPIFPDIGIRSCLINSCFNLNVLWTVILNVTFMIYETGFRVLQEGRKKYFTSPL